MALKTADEYVERLKGMKPNVYVGGRRIRRDDPVLSKSINTVRITFDAAQDPRFIDQLVTTSPLINEKISRFTNLYFSQDDLVKKQGLIRNLCHLAGGCIQRCMATDTINAMAVVSKEIDDAKGTDYHPRFLEFAKYYQKNDLVGSAAMTDVKGDRSKRPHEQADPDLYVRVKEKRKDGIIVRGAKAHITMAPYVDEHLVITTRALTKQESDWAVAFAIPADADGIKNITRIADTRERVQLKTPYNELGVSESLVVFDDVFVPWERVFMCGEWEFAGRLALMFANFHRHSYCGCKPAVSDIIMGAAALVADYNGIGNASHIKDEITEIMVIAELAYAAGIAATAQATCTSSGIWAPNPLYSNCGRYITGVNVYHEFDILTAITGGLAATLPYEQDWLNPETRDYLNKYIMRNPNISSEQQHRLFRFLSDYTTSGSACWNLHAGVHGGGSPVMEKIGIRSIYDLEARKKFVKYLAGIEEKKVPEPPKKDVVSTMVNPDSAKAITPLDPNGERPEPAVTVTSTGGKKA
jgi:4-hydroxybutyryl-CoA dehydratase / vinylacetyl-CoA-Delta-isomerase